MKIKANGIQIEVEDTGADGSQNDRPVVLLIMGLGMQLIAWPDDLVQMLVSRGYRVIRFDNRDCGLTTKVDAPTPSIPDILLKRRTPYTLDDMAGDAFGLLDHLGIERAHLVAHDYGTSVATELIARRERGLLPIELASLTLCNGSMHIELARLKLTQKLLKHRTFGPLLARLTSKRLFVAQMRSILGDPAAVSEAELELHFELLLHNDGRRHLAAVSRYHEDRWRFWHRWIGALTRLDLPTHVLWGRRDPVAVPAIAEQLAREIPGARLTWLDELGHYPMLEDPARWSTALLGALAE